MYKRQTYNGDYSGKRYSALTQIDQSTVKNLTLGWFAKVTAGPGTGGGRGGFIVGGEGAGNFPPGTASIKASALEVDGTIYVSTPDNAWAIDARLSLIHIYAFLFILGEKIRFREVEFLRRHEVLEELEGYESPDHGIGIVWFEVVKIRVGGYASSLVSRRTFLG